MNALRTLPILNRPSRPASPAPPSVQSTTVNGTAALYSGHGAYPSFTHTRQPDKPRSRSLSRQVADKVNSLQSGGNSAAATVATAATASAAPVAGAPQGAINPPATIVSSQPLGGKKPSPPSSRSGTPRVPASPLPAGAAGVVAGAGAGAGAGVNGDGAVGPQGGYMDVIGLRLNETVNKAIAGVDLKAKKGVKKGNGWAVGESVVKELPFPPSDAYLIRAVLRTSVRALSIYTTRLESLLLPALTDPAFVAPLNITHATPASHPLNPAQHFAVSVAHAAWETCEVLEQTLETGKWPRFVAEALRPVMDKLDLVVSKVVQPLLGGLKRDLVASLARTEGTSPVGGKPVGLASIPTPAAATPGGTTPLARETSHQAVGRLTKEISSGGTSRQLTIPVCLQHFAARVDGARKVFELVAKPCQDDGEGWITGVMVAVIWKGMCAVADKEGAGGVPGTRPPSPGSVARALAGLGSGAGKEKDTAAQGGGITPSPSLGGVTAKLASSLSIVPSRSQSRAPSPPRGSAAAAGRLDPTTHALLSLEGLAKRLVAGLVQPPAPEGTLAAENETEHLAREALHEALEALASFRIISSAMHRGVSPSSRILASARRLRDDVEDPIEDELDDAMEDLPAVCLFTIVLHQANLALSRVAPAPGHSDEKAQLQATGLRLRLPHEAWGWTPAEYERQVLSGFSAAEEWGRRVALAIKPDVERTLSALAALAAHPQPTAPLSATAALAAASPAHGRAHSAAAQGEKGVSEQERALGEAVQWVKALGVACEARCGVKIGGAA